MIAVSDVFAENFTPRVMRNFGLEYEDVRQIKPDIIMVSSTGYGYTGPWSDLGAIGFATEAASGLAHMTGYEDGPPVIPEVPYSDFTAAEHTLFAVMAALIHRAIDRGRPVHRRVADRDAQLHDPGSAHGPHGQRAHRAAYRQQRP